MSKEPTYNEATDVLMDAFKQLFPNVRFVTVNNFSDEGSLEITLKDMDDEEWEE